MRFFLLLCKRQVKKLSMLFSATVILVLAGLLSTLSFQSPSIPAIALFSSDETTFSICQKLSADRTHTYSRNLYSFYLAESPEKLYQDVETGYAECGFLFPDNLLSAWQEGRMDQKITVVLSPDSLLQDLATETVFAACFEEYVLNGLNDCLSKTAGSTWTEEEVEALYRRHLNDGTTFSFETVSAPVDHTPATESGIPFQTRTLARLFYLLLFVACYTGGFSVYADRNSGFYKMLSKSRRFLAECAALLTPLVLCACLLMIISFLLLPDLQKASPLPTLSFPAGILSICGFSFVFCLTAFKLLPDQKSYTAFLPPLLLLGSILLLL